MYNDGGPGVCLSRRALEELLGLLLQVPLEHRGHPTFQDCAFAVGHREDLMLATCMRQVGVLPSTVTTDVFGREWFSIRPMLGILTHHPLTHYLPNSTRSNEAWNFWMGRAHMYLPCIEHIRVWVVETPVSFNSFKNVSMFHEATLARANLKIFWCFFVQEPVCISRMYAFWTAEDDRLNVDPNCQLRRSALQNTGIPLSPESMVSGERYLKISPPPQKKMPA